MSQFPIPNEMIKDHRFFPINSQGEKDFSYYKCSKCNIKCVVFNPAAIDNGFNKIYLTQMKMWNYPIYNPPSYYLSEAKNNVWKDGLTLFDLSCQEIRIKDIIL